MSLSWALRLPQVSGRTWRVWWRDYRTFMKTYKTNFIPPLVEPVLYLVAFGFGLGMFVSEIGDVSYAEYIAPALLAISMMNAAFFECTFGSFVRMYYQKTFDAIIATPLNIDEVIMGELLWGATKSTMYTIIVLVIVGAFGLAVFPMALLVVPLSFLVGLLFAGLGMMFTAVSPNIDTLSYPTSLYVTPMMLLSGTFFPLDVLPVPVQQFSWLLLPLVHVVNLSRGMTYGALEPWMLLDLAWIAVGTGIVVVLSINMMRHRLIV